MFKRILAEVKEYKKVSIMASLAMVGEVTFEILLPFFIAFLIDEGINKGNSDAIVKYGFLMILFASLSMACGVTSAILTAKASTGLAKNLRKKMFYQIQEFSFKNIDSFSDGGLVTRLMTDVTNVQNAYQILIRAFVRAPLMFIFAISVSFLINVEIAFIFLIVSLGLSLVLYITIRLAFPIFNNVFEKYDALNARVQENVNNMRVTKAYVKEDFEIEKFKFSSFMIYKLFVKAENLVIFTIPAMQFAMYVAIILVSWIGANLVVNNNLTTGELTSLFSYITVILVSLLMVAMFLVMFVIAMSSMKRIDEVLVTTSDIVSPDNGVKEVTDGRIEFKDICFGYDNSEIKCVLNNIDIKINSGETIGILGGTGSGKSSFVSLIPRLYDVKNGELLVGGINVKDYDLDVLRTNIAMVLQTNILFNGTIKDNIRWGKKDATDEEIINACKLAQAHEFIEQMPDKYDSLIERGGSNVSGGQRQRLCIARALIKNPKILILDDSTSAVDTKTDQLIRESFKNELKDTTKLIISQRISSIQEADRIIVLDDGQINGFDTHEQLLINNAIYRDVYETQHKGDEVDD